MAERANLLAHFEEVFADELPVLRRHFGHLVTDEGFQKGLLLSSRTLAQEVGRYLRSSPEKPSAKVRQVERSLMRYYSRTVMKTTPFGTFCAISGGRFDRENACAGAFHSDPRKKRSFLRLNKAVYTRLLKTLLKCDAVRRKLDVELNPTLRRSEEQWVFLTTAGDREIFQRAALSPVFELLYQFLSEKERLSFDALVELFLDHVDATVEDGVAYLDRLLEMGFLRLRLGLREQEVRWDQPLIELLAPIDEHHARRAIVFLETFRRYGENYARAPLERRGEILKATERHIASFFEDPQSEEERSEEEHRTPPFFEDTKSPAELTLDLGDLEGVLEEWAELTSPLALVRGEQANMRHFFDSRYRSDVGSVSLLRFYEDYYREHFKEYFDRRLRASEEDGVFGNPFGLELIDQLEAARQRLGELVRERWRGASGSEEIVLERGDLEAATAELPRRSDPCRSVSFFVQHLPRFTATGEDALVANTYFTGFGKYFSRFLYLLKDEVEQDLVRSNRELFGGALAEICGDAGFNANLHPPLLPHEIAYPTGEGGAVEARIETSDLAVEADPERPDRLLLRNRATGQEVLPVDLGFLNPQMRPPLYQLLSRMTPASMYRLNMPVSLEDEKEPLPYLVYRPRVSYRGRLILSRRRWAVPPALFPRRQARESESARFLRMRRWRAENGLPEQVFVRAHSLDRPDTGEQKEGMSEPVPSRRQHLYKPQFLDFRNPFLIDLFSRLVESPGISRIVLEERLPDREHLVAYGSERYATELLIQLDFPARKG